jgi:hypothetical protein
MSHLHLILEARSMIAPMHTPGLICRIDYLGSFLLRHGRPQAGPD